MSTADRALHNSIDDVQQRARFRAHRLRLDVVNGYTSSTPTDNSFDESLCSAAHTHGQPNRIVRRWMYDSGASRNTIGRAFVTEDEWKTEKVMAQPIRFFTANGTVIAKTTVMCKVPQLGLRQCIVMDDCSPLISVGADVQDYGNIFH